MSKSYFRKTSLGLHNSGNSHHPRLARSTGETSRIRNNNDAEQYFGFLKSVIRHCLICNAPLPQYTPSFRINRSNYCEDHKKGLYTQKIPHIYKIRINIKRKLLPDNLIYPDDYIESILAEIKNQSSINYDYLCKYYLGSEV